MSNQRHLIKKQVVELTTRGSSARAQSIQDEMSRVYQQRIIPLMDRWFTELSSPDELHRIDLLELDIGQIDLQNFEDKFVEKVTLVLQRELEPLIRSQKGKAATSKQNIKTGSQLELFETFVRTGTLPWWADASHPQLLEENLKYLLSNSPDALRSLLQNLLQETNSLKRIINHYTDKQLAEIAGLFVLPSYKQNIAAYHPILVRILHKIRIGSSWSAGYLRKTLWTHLLLVASVGGREYSTERKFYQAVLKRLGRELGSIRNSLIVEMQEVLKNNKINVGISIQEKFAQLLKIDELSRLEPVSGDDKTKLTRNVDKHPTLPPTSKIIGDEIVIQRQMDERAIINDKSAQANEEQSIHHSNKKKNDPFEEIDELYIGNAGLVILWPFLENFFSHVNLLENKQFKSRATQHRAVVLLQRLLLPDAEAHEYFLPLNKILCGVALEEVLEVDEPPLDSEIEECEHLLKAVIAQAPILNNMTTDGLRGTFLLRPGILSMRDGFWLLRAERETYDIVLGRLPWNWEWVKLPWMEVPMRVEW